MLRALDIACASVAQPLVAALCVIGNGAGTSARPMTFLRPRSKWRPLLNACAAGDDRLWQVAVLFHMRDAFRSGDIWLVHSRRYGDLKQALVPIAEARATARLAVPFEPEAWIADRKARIDEGQNRLATAAREGTIPGGAIENGTRVVAGRTTAVLDLAELVPVHGVYMAPVNSIRVHEHGERPAPVTAGARNGVSGSLSVGNVE